ncbi:MAG: ATP-binding protein [Synechococcales bacterium]|nr:ATP-binding protein [Synechococcales bacterium]
MSLLHAPLPMVTLLKWFQAIAPHELLLALEACQQEQEGLIAELAQTQAELAQAQAALRQSEAQLRLTVDALPVLISYVDAQQCYRFTNQVYQEWFGRSPRNIHGCPVQEVVGDRYYQKIQPYLERALHGEKLVFETDMITVDGVCRWVEATYIPHRVAEGTVGGIFVLVKDISDRKAIERMKDEFVSVISHELRTPLTAVHGSLKLLVASYLGTLPPTGQKMLEIAVNNTNRLVRIINDVLDLERIESGHITLTRRLCDATELIAQAASEMQLMAHHHGITLCASAPSIQVWGDPQQIRQILINLLSNAIKFSSPGGTVWIQAAALPAPPQVQFTVKDQGRGIPAQMLDSIFDRFQQVDASDSRPKGGTGLGLTICRHIVSCHGGRIWVESTLGQGSTFYVTLPLVGDRQATPWVSEQTA